VHKDTVKYEEGPSLGSDPLIEGQPLTVWNHPGPCPRCGEPLDLDPEGITALWD
jgi:hypothetical protein